jgi:hypothetical protein
MMPVVVTAFPVETVAFQEMRNGRPVYLVKLPYSFSGSVVLSLERHEAGDVESWIADRLEDLTAKRSYRVVAGLLVSQMDLSG